MSEVAALLSPKNLRNWWHEWIAEGVDHDAVLKQISEDSGWSGRYAFLIVVSAIISLLGLLMPSVAVLIGAMLLSPLMMPIIGLGFGIATLDFQEIKRAAFALIAGSLIAVGLSVLFVMMSPVQTITGEIAGRTQPTLFDLLVALLSAVAGAYALIRGRGGTVVGVAIAIALMPPLAVVGFGIATLNWPVFAGSLLLFVTNAITISLTAALVARLYGFGSHLSRHHTGWQLLLFVVALGLLSLPLGAALRQIAFESVAQRQVRDTILNRFPDVSRLSQLEIDYTADPIRVRAVVLTPRMIEGADRLLTADVRDRLDRHVDLHVDQVQVSPQGDSVDSIQIARAANSAATRAAEGEARARSDLAMITGAAADSIRFDRSAGTVEAAAARLPGLGLAGYRALEARAARSLGRWSVRVAPPEDVELPDVAIVDGVIDNEALDLAAWGSARLDRAIAVNGGSATQREAVADGIGARGGRAIAGEAGGRLRLEWVVEIDPDQGSEVD